MVNCKMKNPLPGSIPATDFLLYPMLYCKSQACNTDNALSVMALPPRAAVHTILTSRRLYSRFGDIANNPVICNREQYIMHQIHIVLEKMHIPSTCFISDILKLRQRIIFKYRKQLCKICHSRQIWQFRTRNPYHLPFF